MASFAADFETISKILSDVHPKEVWGDATESNFRRMLLVARDAAPENEDVFRLLLQHTLPDQDVPDVTIDDVILSATKFTSTVRRVCRVKAATGGPGTGFLVGPDLVMTAAHVLRKTDGAFFDPTTVKVVFDYLIWKDDKLATLITRGLASDWHFASSLAPQDDSVLPAEDQLDYVIIRIDAALGSASLPSFSKTRGWFDGSTAPAGQPAVDEEISILQHADGEVLKSSTGKVKRLVVNSTRALYATSTHNSSSGSPVVDSAQKLVAIHVWNDRFDDEEVLNEGVSFAAIHADLAAHGKQLVAPF